MKIQFNFHLGIFVVILLFFSVLGANFAYADASIVHDKYAGTITLIGNDGKKFVLEDKNVGAERARDGVSMVSDESRGLYYNWGVNVGYDWDDPMPEYDVKKIEGWGGEEDESDPYLGGELTFESQLKRQGPCQEGYHIPSAGEWINIMKAWCDYDKECSESDYSYFYGKKVPYITMKEGYPERFSKDLLLPRMGSRSKNYKYERDLNNVGHYRTSTKDHGGGPNFYLFEFEQGVISYAVNGGYHAMNLRCIENKKDEGYELYEAHKRAYENGITKQSTMQGAKLGSTLTRIEMAKMLSVYAVNVLGKKPDTSKGEKYFSDVTEKMNSDYNNAVTLSYQLGIMGKGEKFRPTDEVTRAEFATSLSRLLYGTPDGQPYYVTHLNKLFQDGIISNTNPNIKEKRGYVMLMLMRSVNNTLEN